MAMLSIADQFAGWLVSFRSVVHPNGHFDIDVIVLMCVILNAKIHILACHFGHDLLQHVPIRL